MPVNAEGFMRITRLLVFPLLIWACVMPAATQSLTDRNPSQSLPTLPTLPQSLQASVRVDQLTSPFHLDRNELSRTTPGAVRAGERASTIIPPVDFHAVPPRELEAFDPMLGQGDICYSIRGYRVTRDDPESDLTRPAGYSTCQPAARFHVKRAVDLGRQ